MNQRNHKRHDKEFMREAINLIKASDKPIAAIGRELGVHSSTLYDWMRREKKIFGYEESNTTKLNEEEEIRRLRRELADARMERDILKKAVAVFSKHQK